MLIQKGKDDYYLVDKKFDGFLNIKVFRQFPHTRLSWCFKLLSVVSTLLQYGHSHP